MNHSRRGFLRTLTCASAATLSPGGAETSPSGPALRDLAGGRPLMGAAVPSDFESSFSTSKLRLLAEQFDCVTPANCMKWNKLCRREGEYHFGPADRLVAVATTNNQKIVGHTLVFNRPGNYPAWLFRDGQKEADAKLVWKRIEEHLATLMGRYAGKIDSWDVLNEFVEMNPLGYRETDFTRVLGKDYPIRLFKMAAAVDPKAKLVYNDYGIEQAERRKAIMAFVRSLQDSGCRIDVIGSQSHLELGQQVTDGIEATIQECAKLGVLAAFTELDVDVVPRKGFFNPKTREKVIQQNPYTDGAPDEILQQQAEFYRDIFEVVTRNRKHVDRVTFWGVTDADSWLNNWPWKRTNHALLFDREGKPKPAFHAVAKVLANATTE